MANNKNIKDKLNNAKILLDKGKKTEALQRVNAAWDLINKSNITDIQDIAEFISSTAAIFISLSKNNGPEAFEANLAELLKLVPNDNKITLYSIAVFKQTISNEYMNSASLNYAKALDNAAAAVEIVQENFSDETKITQPIIQNLIKISSQINNNQTIIHFKAGDFTEMLASAKMNYNAVNNVLDNSLINSELAQQVAVAYNGLKQYNKALPYLQKAMKIYKNNNMDSSSSKIIALQSYIDTISNIIVKESIDASTNMKTPIDNEYDAAANYFKAGELNPGFAKIREVFKKLQDNSQLNDPIADKSINLLLNLIKDFKMSTNDLLTVLTYTLDKAIEMQNAGNSNGSTYISFTSPNVSKHVIPLLVNAKKFDEAIALSEKIYNAVSKFQPASLYKAMLAENYIAAGKCTEGLTYAKEAFTEIQELNFEGKNNVLNSIQKSINSCTSVDNSNLALTNIKAAIQTCTQLGFTDLELCKDHLLMGENLDSTIQQ